jgi:predicted dehydrogenase
VAVGEQNNYGFEIHGTQGAVYWDFRRMNELGTSLGSKYQDQSIATVWVGPDAGAYARFQPGSASSMSYDDLKVIEGNNFVTSIVNGKPQGATIADAVAAADALDAITASIATRAWVAVG